MNLRKDHYHVLTHNIPARRGAPRLTPAAQPAAQSNNPRLTHPTYPLLKWRKPVLKISRTARKRPSTINNTQLLAMDILALATMKNAAKCDT